MSSNYIKRTTLFKVPKEEDIGESDWYNGWYDSIADHVESIDAVLKAGVGPNASSKGLLQVRSEFLDSLVSVVTHIRS